jgi:hypothetical protein
MSSYEYMRNLKADRKERRRHTARRISCEGLSLHRQNREQKSCDDGLCQVQLEKLRRSIRVNLTQAANPRTIVAKGSSQKWPEARAPADAPPAAAHCSFFFSCRTRYALNDNDIYSLFANTGSCAQLTYVNETLEIRLFLIDHEMWSRARTVSEKIFQNSTRPLYVGSDARK